MNGRHSKLKWLNDELDAKSRSLTNSGDIPHFFWILDKDTDLDAYFGNIADGDACQIIEILAKRYGGGILDRVIDKMIEDDEYFEFPSSWDEQKPFTSKK